MFETIEKDEAKKKRPPAEMKQLGIYVEPVLHKKIIHKCQKKHVSISSIVRDLLEAWVSGKVTVTKNV